MQNKPDYSVYHLHELESALRNVDETANPEEAKLIREYMATGGYTYPDGVEIQAIQFTNKFYKWSLVVTLSLLFLTNLFIFALTIHPLSLAPLAFQTTLLFMIFKNHKQTRMFIKIWSGLSIISGLMPLLIMAITSEINTGPLARNIIVVAGGITFFLLSDRYVKLVPIRPSIPLESVKPA